MTEPAKANGDTLLSIEKGLFYIWNVLYKPQGAHKTNM